MANSYPSGAHRLFAAIHGLQRTVCSVPSGRTLLCVLLVHELIRFARMAITSTSGPIEGLPSTAAQEFAAQHYASSGAQQLGMDQAALAALLAQVVLQVGVFGDAGAELGFLASLAWTSWYLPTPARKATSAPGNCFLPATGIRCMNRHTRSRGRRVEHAAWRIRFMQSSMASIPRASSGPRSCCITRDEVRCRAGCGSSPRRRMSINIGVCAVR